MSRMTKAVQNGKCFRCEGEIIAGTTNVRASRNNPEQVAHAQCFFASGAPQYQYDGLGRIVGKNPRAQQPATATATAHPMPTPKPNGNGGGDLAAIIGSAIWPFVEEKLNAKVNADEVRQIVETAIGEATEKNLAVLRQEMIRTVKIERPDGTVKEIEGLTHEAFEEILTLLQLGLNVLMHGDAGGGKTTLAQQLADALDVPMYSAELGKLSMPSSLLGYTDPQGNFVETDFYRWFTNGGVFLFDEVFNANDNLRTVLNSALDNGICSFPGKGRVKRHPKAYALAADNTVGLGASGIYTSREVADASQRERWVFFHFTYDTKLERALARAEWEKADKWVDWIHAVRTTVKSLNLRHPLVSPRASVYGARILKTGKFGPEKVADMILFKGVDADTRTKILANNPIPASF